MKKSILLLATFILTLYATAQQGDLVFLNVQVDNNAGQPIPFTIHILDSADVTTLPATTNPDGSYYEDFHTPNSEWLEIIVSMTNCVGQPAMVSFPHSGNAPFYFSTVFNYCPDTAIFGCTDPEAVNYNPVATMDDGSCEYETGCTEVTLQLDGPSAWSGMWILYGQGAVIDSDLYFGSDMEYPLCLPDGCYFLTFNISANDSSSPGIATLWQNDNILFSGEFFPGQSTLEFGIGDGCDSTGTVYGCTDPGAINYNPDANVDDGSCEYECDHTAATLVIHTGLWAYEMSWNIVLGNTEVYGGGNYENDSDYEIPLCLLDSCYTFEMFDSYGDGWNGGEWEIFVDGEVIASGGLESGAYGEVGFGVNTEGCESIIHGCTDPEAVNFNPDATVDDGSCAYAPDNDLCENAQPLVPGTLLIDNTHAVENEGIWGECWNFGSGEGEQTSLWFSFTTPETPAEIHIEAMGDGTYSLTDTQFGLFDECGGDMLYCDGNAGDGLFSAFHFPCGELEQGQTYLLVVDGWYGDTGTCYLSYSVSAGCDSIVYGCTDPEAINYNPDATVDDGSCEYECDHTAATLVIHTGLWAYEMSWNIVLGNTEVYGGGNYENDSDYEIPLCLLDSCYTFEMFDSYGDGWNGGEWEIFVDGEVIASGGLESGAYGEVGFGVNTEGCGSVIYGCTDPEAVNYNPDATVDDGSCEYAFSCEISFTVMPDSSGENTIWIVPSANIFDASVVLWDFGDGTTSTDLFPQHQYPDEGPYTLCLYVLFENPDGSSCDIQYCVELSGNMIGSGLMSSGFQINVIDPTIVATKTLAADIGLEVFPNPTNGSATLYFDVPGTEAVHLRVFDITAKSVFKAVIPPGEDEVKLDLSDEQPGVYIIALTTSHGVAHAKIVKR